MFNWFDLMRQAQTSAALDALTRQFQLSGDQPQKTIAAFIPAFAMGLQHAMASSDPTRLMQSMMSGAYQNFWQAGANPFTPQAQQEGRRLLDQIFGSDEISRRVAHQAADYAGISAETMQQLLPLLAGIVAGGMSQWMMAQAQAMQAFAAPKENKQARSGAANPWADLWSSWMKAATPAKKPASPLEDVLTAFLQMQPAQPSRHSEPEAQDQASAPSFDEMMEKGREMQIQYLTSLQSIFAEAWKIDDKKA
ncbi:hypothetical protein GGR34_001782 [Microvirga flocculans]|uniref:DUF937 domain-containing protein n=1 Tax=Microvirga flocculans TaxID=217168 RepID=A0A7W6IEQ1_9HYPH|nr:DUF937 domain-containing protein [Microvirga flocculans]MBB4040131.1 hypothetical protein [Microvirga flocculans]